jgi:hypothetical protein
MLPKAVFIAAAMEPKVELQGRIEKLIDHNESLEEILEFLQNGPNAPAYIKKGFKDYSMEAGWLFYQGHIVVPDNDNVGSGMLWLHSPLSHISYCLFCLFCLLVSLLPCATFTLISL